MRTCELTREGISYQILQNLIEQVRVEKIKYGYYQWQDEKAFTEVSVITVLFLTAVTLIFIQMQSYAEKYIWTSFRDCTIAGILRLCLQKEKIQTQTLCMEL